MKKLLFVMSSPPFCGVRLQEQLDVILTAAAFDQPVALLLLDDGVFQLVRNQKPQLLHGKDTASIYKALEIYDVNDIYAELDSLLERGLKPGDLSLPVKEIYRKDVAALMKRFNIVVGG